jgi:hypothetical protein
MVGTFLFSVIMLSSQRLSYQPNRFDGLAATRRTALAAVVKRLTRSVPTPPTRLVTANDCVLFKRDPTKLVNKKFVLEAEDDGGGLCEVMEARYANGAWAYQVRFEDCSDSVNIPIHEVIEMLDGSYMFEA